MPLPFIPIISYIYIYSCGTKFYKEKGSWWGERERDFKKNLCHYLTHTLMSSHSRGVTGSTT